MLSSHVFHMSVHCFIIKFLPYVWSVWRFNHYVVPGYWLIYIYIYIYIWIVWWVIYPYSSSVCLYVCLPKLVYTICSVIAVLVPGSLFYGWVAFIGWSSLWSIACGPWSLLVVHSWLDVVMTFESFCSSAWLLTNVHGAYMLHFIISWAVVIGCYSVVDLRKPIRLVADLSSLWGLFVVC